MNPLNLQEGDEVVLHIANLPLQDPIESDLKSPQGAWKGIHDPEKLLRNVYAEHLVISRSEPEL